MDFKRCQVYKLNISKCLTGREQDYYNLYCDGISQKKLLERLGKKFYTPQMVAETFHITEKQAKVLLENQLDKKYFKEYLLNEIMKFPADSVRKIRQSAIYITDVNGNITDEKRTDNRIVWFENECVRRCNADLKQVPLLNQVVILKCGSEALTGLLNQIIQRGVDIDDKHYVFYTSSTGQMKDAEITLLEEEYWKANQYALMCGLTEECINSKGGINMGKYFAAKALNISNSIRIDTDISINDVLIVPDFKTMVTGKVNYLDVNTLDLEEKEEDIEIEHMDGAGCFIPGTLPCSCQIRGGWLKGAVFPFDFHKFIQTYKDKLSSVHMRDAWGKLISVDEFMKAKVILTDSQFKMRKYYNSMEEYRNCFKKSGLSITINNCTHKPGDEVRVAYQPLQTIPRKNLTDKAIENVTRKTIDYINNAKRDPKTALKLMGIELESAECNSENHSEEAIGLNPFYASILKYPEMLNDIHVQKTMKSALLSARKRAQGCKLILDGMWSYICPDLFAFCEWLFLGEDVPNGLVPNGYVFNHYYDDKDIKETCCIRYPHLSDCEHAIRKILKSEECGEWFHGYDTIVSSHDLISKVIQADWDGDHICNVHDKAFLDLLDRNKYPLYYKMMKAEPSLISNDAIMLCLTSSFFGNENIGYVSNSITKIFDSVDEPDIKLVRVLCAFNNYVIDYFKTQRSMDLKEYAQVYEGFKDSKCPWFFKYAKDKKIKRCDEYNRNGNCDRIGKYIKEKTMDKITKVDYSNKEEFNPEMFKNKTLKVNRRSPKYSRLRSLLLELKNEKNQTYKEIKTNLEAKESDKQIFYIYCSARIKDIISDRETATNYLVDIEYYTDENMNDKKDILWNCFGDVLYRNLCHNVKDINVVNIPIKRKLYQSSKDKEKEIIESRKEVKKKQEELRSVPITQPVYDYLMGVKTLANRVNDKYIMFLLYVFRERFKRKHDITTEYIRIYKGAKKQGKITCATIDALIDSQCTKKGLDKLQKKGYIRIEECETYDKVYLLNIPDDPYAEVFFSVISANPLYDLWEKNGDRKIGYCEICKEKYIVTGNAKTCPKEKCSKLLSKINKI